MLANIQILVPDRLIEPQLKVVVEKVALAKPNLTFIHDKKVYQFCSHRGVANGSVSAPEGKQWLTKFRVLDNGAPAGDIQIEYSYSRSAPEPWRIGVRSHLVSTTRGSRGMTYSSNEARVIANAKKYLIGQSYGYRLYRELRGAQRVASGAATRLTMDIRHGQFLTNATDAQVLLHSYLTGAPVDVQIESAMRAKLATPKFEQALAEFKLADWFSDVFHKNKCRFIHRHEDGYMAYEDLEPDDEDQSHKARVVVMQFDDLPLAVQEKLAVLQLMSDTEIVKDVGQRVDENSFWVVRT